MHPDITILGKCSKNFKPDMVEGLNTVMIHIAHGGAGASARFSYLGGTNCVDLG